MRSRQILDLALYRHWAMFPSPSVIPPSLVHVTVTLMRRIPGTSQSIATRIERAF
jgi:hypothetical protein